MITQEYLKLIFNYDENSGIFTRKITINKGKAGDKVGTINADGYCVARVKGKLFYLHRLAWIYVHGNCQETIDHINGIRSDNRLCNLRICSHLDNHKNKPIQKNNTTGYKGVTYHKKHKHYFTRATLNGVVYFLGSYKTAKEAGEAYLNFAKNRHGQYFNNKTQHEM